MKTILRRQHYLLLMVLAITAGLYLQVVWFEFVSLDDSVNVYSNARVINFSWENLLFFWKGTYQHLYIPLTYTLWGTVAKISQLIHVDNHAQLFHAVNLLIHLGNITILYFILQQLFADDYGAALGVLLFAVHPVQVETVAWVTGLKDLLNGFFCLAGLALYILYCKEKMAGRKSRLLYSLATLCFLFALLSKPTAVVLPLISGIIGRLLLQRTWRELLLELIPWAILSLPIVFVTSSVQSGSTLEYLPDFRQRILVAGDAVSFYLFKISLPISLAFDYSRAPQYVLGQNWIYLTGIAPYAALLFLWWRFPSPFLRTGVGLFLAPLLPLLGFIPFLFQDISTVSDRYLYLALTGPAFLVSWLFTQHRKTMIRVFALSLLVLLCLKTFFQTATWENSSMLYRHAITVNPRSWTSHMNLGKVLLAQGDPETARINFLKVLEIRPDTPQAYIGLGNAYNRMGNNSAAYASMRRAMELEKSTGE